MSRWTKPAPRLYGELGILLSADSTTRAAAGHCINRLLKFMYGRSRLLRAEAASFFLSFRGMQSRFPTLALQQVGMFYCVLFLQACNDVPWPIDTVLHCITAYRFVTWMSLNDPTPVKQYMGMDICQSYNHHAACQ
jgi:hypothetical protein